MAPAGSTPKASYKSYEAQARLVRAMVAAHPDVKWNYKGEPTFISIYSSSTPALVVFPGIFISET